MGGKRRDSRDEREVRRQYVRGPRWSAARFHFVCSVIAQVVARASRISRAPVPVPLLLSRPKASRSGAAQFLSRPPVYVCKGTP